MSWDDDFPDEQTDPALVKPAAPVDAQRPFPSDPSGAMRVQPGAGQFSNPPTGSHPVGFSHSYPGGTAPSAANPSTGRFPASQPGAPSTGGFRAANPAHDPAGGVQPIIRNNTSRGMHAVPPPADAPVSMKMRVRYGAVGFGAGAVTGLLLGLMNSALEDIPLGAGLSLTMQIAVWFGLMVGILTAWRPERFANAWDRITGS